MKILVAGAGGFVGRRLCGFLADEGHDVLGLVRPGKDIPDTFYSSGKITPLEIDLAAFSEGDLPFGIEAVYFLAQSSHFREFPEKADDVFEVNINAVFKFCQWARESGVEKFILVSSGGIYGAQTGKPLQENERLRADSPLGFYLGSKLCSEILFQNYMEYFKTAVILRPFFIYGGGQKNDMFIARIISSVEEGRPVYLQGKEGLKVNPIYVEDAVAAMYKAVSLTGKHVINIAGPDILSLKEITEIISSQLGIPAVYVQKEGIPSDYIGDVTMAAKNLTRPLTGFIDGIKLTLNKEDKS